MFRVKFTRHPLARLLVLLAYALMSEPRMAWALGLSPAPPAGHACAMAGCRCQHGPGAQRGACCHAANDALETKYPGVQALLRQFEAQERAENAETGQMKAPACGMGGGEAAPAPGRPHTLMAPQSMLSHALPQAGSLVRLQALVEPRGEALFKVPLI